MLQDLISNEFFLTILGQFASFCGLLACLTISMYGGNEQGKIPENYTYEQFIEYRRTHGTEATRKKLQEIEEQRLEKARNDNNKKSGGGVAPRDKNSAGAKHLSKNQISTKTNEKRQSAGNASNKSKKEKPKKFLDQLGINSSSKKTKKKTARSDRSAKSKHRSLEVEEVYLDDTMRKAASPPRGEQQGDSPLVAVPDHLDKSQSSTRRQKPPSLFSNLDTSNSKKAKRFKLPASDTTLGTVRESVTPRESKTARERKLRLSKPLKPAASSPKPNDEFTPTVFEAINAPVQPVVEKSQKVRKVSHLLAHDKETTTVSPTTTSPPTLKEKRKKKNLYFTQEDKTIGGDCSIDVNEPVPELAPEVKQNDLNEVKEKLKEKHQKMIERQAKIEKKKQEKSLMQEVNKLPTDPKKVFIEPPTDRATSAASKKQQKKSKRILDKKGPQASPAVSPSKPSSDHHDNKTVCATTTQQASIEPEKAKSPSQHQKNTSDTNQSDKTDKTKTGDEFDKTEEDEEIFTVKDEKIVRGIELRKVQSAKCFAEKPPDKLKITASTRIFGHRCENPRTQKAALKAIQKMKMTASSPHHKSTVSKSTSSSKPSTTSPSHSVSTTTWSSTTASESPLTTRSSSSKKRAASRASSTTTWTSTTMEEDR